MKHLNETHDQALRSWVSSANVPGNDFPIQNLPFASFKRRGIPESYRVGVAIGDMVLDMAAAISPQVQGDLATIFDGPANQASETLSAWLQNLGIVPRDLRSTPAGLEQLHQALGSSRGRNFVGSTA